VIDYVFMDDSKLPGGTHCVRRSANKRNCQALQATSKKVRRVATSPTKVAAPARSERSQLMYVICASSPSGNGWFRKFDRNKSVFTFAPAWAKEFKTEKKAAAVLSLIHASKKPLFFNANTSFEIIKTQSTTQNDRPERIAI